jgi:hypothetical protein
MRKLVSFVYSRRRRRDRGADPWLPGPAATTLSRRRCAFRTYLPTPTRPHAPRALSYRQGLAVAQPKIENCFPTKVMTTSPPTIYCNTPSTACFPTQYRLLHVSTPYTWRFLGHPTLRERRDRNHIQERKRLANFRPSHPRLTPSEEYTQRRAQLCSRWLTAQRKHRCKGFPQT